MATRKQDTESTLGRLSKRGEDALGRLVDELGKNDRLTDALGRAMSAKGRLDGASRRARGGVGVAGADEVKELRKQVERLEKRLAKLEGAGGKKTAASKTTTKSRTRKTTGKATEKAASPAPGRAVGGGTGRGSASGGTAAT